MSTDTSSTDKLTILLVENSKSALALLTMLLESKNYKVIKSTNGPEAIDILEKTPVNLVVLDVYMPIMNGYEVTEKIRSSNQHYSNIPIFAYSASESISDIQKCKNAGVNEYIVKNDDNSNLLDQLAKFR